jgi:hypothetical protein
VGRIERRREEGELGEEEARDWELEGRVKS